MSDGMSDANATGRLARRCIDAAYELAEALKAADEGHRGLCPDVLDDVNGYLKDVGYEIRRKR